MTILVVQRDVLALGKLFGSDAEGVDHVADSAGVDGFQSCPSVNLVQLR